MQVQVGSKSSSRALGQRAARSSSSAAAAAAPRRRIAHVARAQKHQQQQQQQPTTTKQQQRPVQQRLASALGAAALSLGLALSAPSLPPAVAAGQGLADLVREDYGFIDADGDGVITRDDLRAFNAGLSADEGLPAIGDGQLDFSLKLFDLNQDGTLTAEELLRSLALDGAVSDDAVDADVYGVFDANRNGKVDAGEWQKALGDLGGGTGDGAKRYVFERVDRLTDSGGQLNESDFGTALMLMRTIVLGY